MVIILLTFVECSPGLYIPLEHSARSQERGPLITTTGSAALVTLPDLLCLNKNRKSLQENVLIPHPPLSFSGFLTLLGFLKQ